MSDVTILYQGGSGGFALYYYLLLSGRYQYSIETVQHMIAQQFPAELSTNPTNWKAKEFWPDNFKLKTQPGPKIFLICNPLFNPDIYDAYQSFSKGTHKILLYTNLHLQLRMAYEKKAYWFTNVSRQHFNAPDNNKHYMRQIITSGKSYNDTLVDPTCLDVIEKFSPDQIVRLEDFVRSSALDNFSESNQHQLDFLDFWIDLQSPKTKLLLEK